LRKIHDDKEKYEKNRMSWFFKIKNGEIIKINKKKEEIK